MKEINLMLFLLAILVGFSLASQAGVNAQLRTALSSPLQAAFLSFLLGTLVLGFIVLAQGGPWFSSANLMQLPWWAWLGGLLGAFNIAVSIYLVPKLGALALAIALVCGQVIASLFYDQYGYLGYPKLEITPSRLMGALLVVLGVMMVAKKP